MNTTKQFAKLLKHMMSEESLEAQEENAKTLFIDPSMISILALPEILKVMQYYIAQAMHASPRENLATFWSLVREEDKYSVIRECADNDASDRRFNHTPLEPLETPSWIKSAKHENYYRLCEAAYEGDSLGVVSAIEAADPRWYVDRMVEPGTSNVARHYKSLEFVIMEMRRRTPPPKYIRPDVNDAVEHYVARQHALRTMSIFLRGIASTRCDPVAPPVSLLDGHAHLLHFIADAIADNDRAFEGVP